MFQTARWVGGFILQVEIDARLAEPRQIEFEEMRIRGPVEVGLDPPHGFGAPVAIDTLGHVVGGPGA